MKQLLTLIKYFLLVVFIVLLVLHFIIKDRYFQSGVLFYATPLPLIIIFGFLICLFFYRNKRLFLILCLINLGLGIYFFTHYFGSPQESTNDKTQTVMLWNVAQNQPLPTDIIIKHMKETRPDVVALVEALKVSHEDMGILASAFPDYEFRTMYGTMLIGVRGKIENVAFNATPNVYKLNHISALIDNKKTTIVLVDINAVPMIDKGIPLGIVDNFLQKNKADILLGDFNTPYESMFFEPFKEEYQSFHPYSIGMSSTWPLPFPVIEIDQIWLAKHLKPLRLEKFSYENSDHKLLIGHFEKKSTSEMD